MTVCKCIKKAIVTFALATINLILFIEEYYSKHEKSRRNRNLQNTRVQFKIPHSPTSNPANLSSSTIQSTPQTPSQQNTSNIPSDYLGSTPTSDQIRENPFNPPATTETLPYWVTHVFPKANQI